MKRIVLILLVFLVSSMAYGKSVQDGSITVTTSAQSITITGAHPKSMLVSVETGAVRVGFKTAPTATTGVLLQPGDTMTVYGHHDIAAFSVIRNSGVSSATVRYVIFDD
jgi:hypothetical protein